MTSTTANHERTIDWDLLTPRQRLILGMRQDGLTYRQIAERINRSRGSVIAMAQRAKKILKEWGR